MQVPPNTATEYDVRQTFMGACRKLLHDDEAIQKKIKIVLNTPKGKIVQRKKNSSTHILAFLGKLFRILKASDWLLG